MLCKLSVLMDASEIININATLGADEKGGFHVFLVQTKKYGVKQRGLRIQENPAESPCKHVHEQEEPKSSMMVGAKESQGLISFTGIDASLILVHNSQQ